MNRIVAVNRIAHTLVDYPANRGLFCSIEKIVNREQNTLINCSSCEQTSRCEEDGRL